MIDEKTDQLASLEIVIDSIKITNQERKKFKAPMHSFMNLKNSDLDKMTSKEYNKLLDIIPYYRKIWRKDAGLPAPKPELLKFAGIDIETRRVVNPNHLQERKRRLRIDQEGWRRS